MAGIMTHRGVLPSGLQGLALVVLVRDDIILFKKTLSQQRGKICTTLDKLELFKLLAPKRSD